ncbi:hypothetical protein PRZ48_003882 [Zasmidium cellare]|uniref:Uncharacterized protein n=1 Tax=Zasmidium cellare TaxID=395010 RepID=A0ABR0EWC6_ZASCE|nr:hypothetical protein PRZ48_003882 [Zasmidium cellare]
MVTSDYVQSNTVWYAASLWNASLILAIFALIAAGQEQMLLTKMRAAFDRAFPHFGSDSGLQTPLRTQQRSMDDDDYHVLKLFLFSPQHYGKIDRTTSRAPRSNDVELQNAPTSTVESRTTPEWFLSKTMMFLWQCPLAFLSYSWVCFIAAFTLHTIHPPLTSWNEHAKVAVFYLAFLIPSLVVFFWCGTLPMWHSSCTRKDKSILVTKQKHQRVNTYLSIQTQRRRNST